MWPSCGWTTIRDLMAISAYEDSSRVACEKPRARLLRSSPSPHLCRCLSRESEELDEGPHALFLTAARKSLGSCQFGDTMEARPKQFRYNLWLRVLPLKQLQELGKLRPVTADAHF